jgi:hypothetical protein
LQACKRKSGSFNTPQQAKRRNSLQVYRGIKTMQSIELVLDYSLYIIWYGFFTLFIFDFLIGLFALIKKTFTTPSIQLISPINPQSTQLQITGEAEDRELLQAEASIVPKSKADEATIQYLEMTGCDINDFDSIAQGRQFLDKYAPWTIEMETPPVQGIEQQSIFPIPDPWFETVADLSPAEVKPSPDTQKLTFNQVCIEFAQVGLALERHRSGHYCYRVVFGCNSSSRFKTLQEALDWLAVSKQSTQSDQTKSTPNYELQTAKLTFSQVCLEFEKRGYKFERYRSGRFRYRFWIAYGGFSYQFKTLQEAVDWLALSQQPKKIITIKA